MRALVFSGGGAKGAYEAGVAKRLSESRRRYDVYCGTSAGAINAAFLAQYASESEGSEALVEMWKRLTAGDLYESWNFLGPLNILWKPSLYSTAPLRRLLKEHVDPRLVAASGKKLRVSAVSLMTGSRKIWTEQSGDELREGVRASASFPIILEPTEIDGDLFVDGGLQQNTPLTDAIAAGATDIDVVLLDAASPKGFLNKHPLAIEIAFRSLSTIQVEMEKLDLNVITLHNRLLDAGCGDTEKSSVKIRTLRTKRPLGGVFDLTPSTILDHINAGYKEAETLL